MSSKFELDYELIEKLLEPLAAPALGFSRKCQQLDLSRASKFLRLGKLFGLKVSIHLEYRRRRLSKKESRMIENQITADRIRLGLEKPDRS